MPKQVAVHDPHAAELLLQALRGRARGRTELVKVTSADAVALTGMPSAQAEPALKSLVSSYKSHLAVTEDGELVYEFDPALERRDRVTLGERLRSVGNAVWRGFTLFFKIWIMVVMIAYVVAFVAMMISLMFARQSSDRDDRRGGGGMGFPWIWYFLMPDLAPPPTDRWGRPIARRRDEPPPKRFYQSVFDFVFGPKAAPVDPRALEKRLVAFLRDKKGRVTAAELVALTGASLEAAEEELTRLMVDYDGEVEVADDGTLIYVFEALLDSAEKTGGSWRYAWDEPETASTLTGNSGTANAVVAGFTGFNLIASLTVGPAFLQRAHLAGEPALQFLVTLFPLIFSMVFFAVPATRALVERGRRRKRARRRIRRELLREIWAQPNQLIDPEALSQKIAERTGRPAGETRAELERLLPELDADVDTDSEGRMRYKFPRLDEERAAIEKARAAAPERKLGPVIFSSEDQPR